jgi:hypothetical protein
MADLTVANTIRDQLGRRFAVMTGAKNWLGSDNSLSFKIGRNARGITHVRVTLRPDDLYNVEFLACRGSSVDLKTVAGGVYADRLAEVIGAHVQMEVTL